MATAEIVHGDVLATLRTLTSDSFDAIFCDPPYGIRFHGHRWDYSVPSVEVWREALRVLKPGAAMLAFGGARTWHRAAVAIEDAGFEIRDTLMWLYGTGQPHSRDVSKALDEAAGKERPVVGVRPIAYADSPSGYTSTSQNSTARKGGFWTAPSGEVSHGRPITAPVSDLAVLWDGYGTNLKPANEPIMLARKPLQGTVDQNVARWGVGAIAIDATRVNGGRWPANVLFDEDAISTVGAAARTFYCAKVGAAEGKDNPHPNKKPIALTTYLARLIRPPQSGRLLVPYAGSGSEMVGALRAGWVDVMGIEDQENYIAIARRRLADAA